MAKPKMNLLYVIGCAAIVIGFCIPMFKIGPFTVSGLDYIGDFNSTTICALLVLCGGIAGLVCSFVPVKNAKLIKIIAVVAALVGMLLLFGVDSRLGFKILVKVAYIGFYAVLAGIVLALAGALTEK